MSFGSVNYIGAISTNNGIRQTINAPITWRGNCITVNYNGSVGHAFYQPYEFYASDDVNILYSKSFDLDENIALYICTSLFKASAKYSYSSKWTKERMEKSKIILPVKRGNLDLTFMRRYIATLKAERVATLKAYLQAAGLSDTILSESELSAVAALRQNRLEWKEFPVSGKHGVFDVVNTHSILKAQVVPDSGTIPYVGAGESNNSIQTYISFDSSFLEKGDSIMIGGKTMVITYQEEDYFSNDSHNLALYYKEITNPGRNIQLFLVAALKGSLKPKYHWGDSISKAKIDKDILMLPVRKDGTVDYKFIKNLISAQTKLCIQDILNNKDLEISTTQSLIEEKEYSVDDNDFYQQAAEPYEIYKKNNIKETILIGCYRDKKHLEWILRNHLYNIRYDDRKGSAKGEPECIAKAVRLYLYNLKDNSKVKVYEIKRPQEMSGKELGALGYPRKSPGKNYMVFSLGDECNYNQFPLNVNETLSSFSNHINGAPVFIEPD